MEKDKSFLGTQPVVQRLDERYQHGALRLGRQDVVEPLARPAITLMRTRGQGVHQGGDPEARTKSLAALDAFWSRVLATRAAP